jgi:hypothetical protein
MSEYDCYNKIIDSYIFAFSVHDMGYYTYKKNFTIHTLGTVPVIWRSALFAYIRSWINPSFSNFLFALIYCFHWQCKNRNVGETIAIAFSRSIAGLVLLAVLYACEASSISKLALYYLGFPSHKTDKHNGADIPICHSTLTIDHTRAGDCNAICDLSASPIINKIR